MPRDGSMTPAPVLGYDGLGERSPRAFIPYFDHVADDVVALRDGRLMAMFRLRGRSWYLAPNSVRNAGWRLAAGLMQLIADEQTEVTQHLCVDRDVSRFDIGSDGTPFAREFWRDYAGACLGEAKTVEWYLCISVKPALTRGWHARWKARKGAEGWVDAPALRALQMKCAAILAALRWHGVERLGTAPNAKGTLCSAIGAALVYVRTLRRMEVPLAQPAGSFALACYPDRVVHGPLGFTQLRDGGASRASYGRMFTLKGYPLQPRTGMFDDLIAPKHGTPMASARFVITNHAQPIARAAAAGHLELIFNRITVNDSKAVSQLHAIEEALDELATGREVRARHAWTLAVHADDPLTLDETASEVMTQLRAVGCTPAPAGLASEAVYWGQWHGNRAWCNRPARIGMQRLAWLASLDGFPLMGNRPKWGNPLLRFLTPGLTPYDVDLHSYQNGNTLFVAPTRSGKTLLMGVLLTMATFVVGPDGLIFLIDKDRSNALTVRANGGSYTIAKRGKDSGFAPLLRLGDAPADRELIADLLRAMIRAEDATPLLPVEAEQLAEGVAHVLMLPPQLRSIGAVHSYLPPGSAADRLKPWCRGQRRGWAFDGEADTVDLDNRICAVDMTALLDDTDILPIAALYLMNRVRAKMDGHRRGIFVCEEAKFFLGKPEFRQAFEDFSYTGGKKDFPIWLVTQQPEHILDLPNGGALLGQFRTRWLLGNERAMRDAYCGGGRYGDGFHCTPREFETIQGGMLVPRSVLLQRPGESELLRFDLSPIAAEYVPILSATPDSVDLWDRIAADLETTDPAAIRPVFLSTLHKGKSFHAYQPRKARQAAA